ncbi:polysaccharide biosynthesis tyrosine autokinase [Nocardioides dubius]|uniref:non-specific protein-tyrosine kinase n=1 Tax=Nocardioides dubius TaxID=317019 RepID=A0ABN1U5K6_9ACTN
MDLKDLLHVLGRRWKTIVSLFLLAVIASGVYSFLATPQYESKARIFISTDVDDPTEAIAANFISTSRVTSYADLATNYEIMQLVIDELNLDRSPNELADQIKAEVEPLTVIINITVTDPDPAVAQQIARVHSEAMTDYIGKIDAPKGAVTPIRATVADAASYDPDPVAPRTVLNVIIAGIIGLIVGIGIALLREVIDNTVKTAEHVDKYSGGAGVIAHLAHDPEMAKHPLFTDLSGYAPRAEAFRVLRTNLQFLDLDNQPRSFVITSAIPGEGKTSTSTNLAIALAQAGQRVLLVDGDLRRPRIADILGLEASVGMTTVLVGKSTLAESIQVHQASGVSFLAGGPLPPNPTEVLQSQATRDLIERLRTMFDVVIIDAPPLLPVADAAILARAADGAIMVVRYGKTTRDQLEQATGRLQQVDARMFGVVINRAPRRATSHYYYYYGDGEEETLRPVR